MLTKQELNIDVLTVEVKAIRVGKKQMTQALFRQLPYKPIIDPLTGEIIGEPWCSVNYFWGDCYNNHTHLVWQKDGKIYRDCFFEDWGRDPSALARVRILKDNLYTYKEDLKRSLYAQALLFILNNCEYKVIDETSTYIDFRWDRYFINIRSWGASSKCYNAFNNIINARHALTQNEIQERFRMEREWPMNKNKSDEELLNRIKSSREEWLLTAETDARKLIKDCISDIDIPFSGSDIETARELNEHYSNTGPKKIENTQQELDNFIAAQVKSRSQISSNLEQFYIAV